MRREDYEAQELDDDPRAFKEIEAGTFKRASAEKLATRRIVKARRPAQMAPVPEEPATTNPFASVSLAPAPAASTNPFASISLTAPPAANPFASIQLVAPSPAPAAAAPPAPADETTAGDDAAAEGDGDAAWSLCWALGEVGAALPPGALGHLRGAADALVAGLALPAAVEVAAAALARLVRRGVPETFVDSSLDTSIARRYAIAAASSRCL